MAAYSWKGSEMSRIWISDRYTEEIKRALAADGHEIASVRPCEAVSEPISMHADIFLCKLGSGPKSAVFHGNTDLLGARYPADVLYNAVVTERFMICNIKTVCEVGFVCFLRKLIPFADKNSFNIITKCIIKT